MLIDGIKNFFSKQTIEKSINALKPDQLLPTLKADRYALFCVVLVGFSLLLKLILMAGSSTAHPEQLLSKFISAAEDADLETMSEMAPSKRYNDVASRLGDLYYQDVVNVVVAAQKIGGEKIRSGYVNFINKRDAFNKSLQEDNDFRRLPWAEKEAAVVARWAAAGGSETSFVSDVTTNAYGVKGFFSVWNEMVKAYRSNQRFDWKTKQILTRDSSGKEMMSSNKATEIINYLSVGLQGLDTGLPMAETGWAEAASDSRYVVGTLSYEQTQSYDFKNTHGQRLLPLAIMAFYDEEYGVEEKDSIIEPAGEGLFQPGVASASGQVKGGLVSSKMELEEGKWRIRTLQDINDVGSLYNIIKAGLFFAPGSSAPLAE
jgi:hypothetical protein